MHGVKGTASALILIFVVWESGIRITLEYLIFSWFSTLRMEIPTSKL
jgi:hypothetical protein